MILAMSIRPTSDMLREFRQRMRYSQAEIAKLLGIDRGRWANWEYGKAEVPQSIVDRLEELGFPDRKGSLSASEGRVVSLAGTELVPIPVVGRVSAGDGTTNVDSEEGRIYVPPRLAQLGGIGWVVDGESMMPMLEPGDVTVFREQRQPRRGYIFLVERDGEARVKILDWEDGRWIMRSINPAYDPEPLDNWALLGMLIGWYRSQGSRETLDSDPGGLRYDQLARIV